MKLHNRLEPAGLIRHFQEWPPEGFTALSLDGGVPAFSAPFDLLTTVEPAIRRKLDGLPFRRWWNSVRCPRTCFIGTTVSEYALLPMTTSPEMFAEELLSTLAPRYPFLIVKDIPRDATLIGDAAYACSRRLAEVFSELGFVLVEGQALAYVPIDFTSTDEFLARLSHARRKNLRRKLRSSSRVAIEAVATGDERFSDDALVARLYELYLNVYRQSEIHFDLLTSAFFQAVLRDGNMKGVVFCYRVDGELIGYNLCFSEGDVLVDKYVGFVYPQARDHNLYVVSWFHNIEYALARGLRCYIAGWTDSSVKRELGAMFTFTQHAICVRNPVLRAFLRLCKSFFESDRRWEASHVRGTHS